MKKRWAYIGTVGIVLVLIVGIAVRLLYRYNYIPHRRYTNADFGIEAYVSGHDQDGDGVDDQTDILAAAKAYVATKPFYKSKYYDSGYPDDGYGVCTDVVAFALRDAGYDLQALMHADISANTVGYDIMEPDPKIDFRRVRNQIVYFGRTAQRLTLDPMEIDQWQGGDIVVWHGHVGIISDARNHKGVAFVIHNGRPGQPSYEEDILTIHGEIIGHFRIGPVPEV